MIGRVGFSPTFGVIKAGKVAEGKKYTQDATGRLFTATSVVKHNHDGMRDDNPHKGTLTIVLKPGTPLEQDDPLNHIFPNYHPDRNISFSEVSEDN